MRRRRKRGWIVMILLIGAAIVAVALIGVVRLVVKSADTSLVDLAGFTLRDTPNQAVACPVGLCRARTDFITDPVALSADALAAKVLQLPRLEPRTEIVARDDAAHRFVLVQRSLVFGFPDSVNIAIQPVDASHATLAIYSRSNYVRGDFGVNLARVKRWLELLGVAWHAA